MPVGGENGLLKCICVWITQEIRSRTLIHPVMNQVHLEWITESFIHKLLVILFSCLTFFSSESWEKHNSHWGKKKEKKKIKFFFYILYISRIMQFYFAHKQLLKSPVFYVACWFLFMVFSSNKWFAKKRHRINVWYHYLITLESKLGIEKNQTIPNPIRDPASSTEEVSIRVFMNLCKSPFLIMC